MSRATQTIGAGFRALGGANMASFSLEFLSQSGTRRPGSTETIVVPYAEMGRDRSCAIRFDSTETTVSRKHAAISHENGQYFITPLSSTNQTFVNGAPINGKTPLSNGSEIQLSSSGPRMRFLASQTKTSTMRLTQRMQMFAAQSMRPYRRAVISLALILVASVSVLGYYSWDQTIKFGKAQDDIAAQSTKIGELEDINTALADDLNNVSKNQKALKKDLKKQKKINDSIRSSIMSDKNINSELANMEDDVYFIYTTFLSISIDGDVVKSKLKYGLAGTGFLLKDGRFVTALHVVMPWFFKTDESAWRALNVIHTKGDYVNLEFDAISPSGNKMRLSSEDFIYDNSNFDYEYDEDGKYLIPDWADDWAWIKTNQKGKIKADDNLSKTLNAGETIYTLGYTYAMAQQSGSNYNPLLSKMSVAQRGLDKGVIKVSGRSFDSGNSGGPGFAVNKKGKLRAIGIVSYKNNVLGGLVPIASIY